MFDLISSQVFTEKSSKLLRFNKYTFNTSKKLTKIKFKMILEEVFDVKVISLNSLIMPLKRCRRGKFAGYKNSYKRFYVTINPDKTIPFFSSL